MEFLQAYWLVFELPLVGAFIYLILQSASGFGDHDVDHDVDVDFDHDVDIGDHDIGIEHVNADLDHDHDLVPVQPGAFIRLFSFFGLGKVPMSLLIICFSSIWGVVGLMANVVLGDNTPNLWPISIVAALLSSTFGTKFLAQGLSKLLPRIETYGVKTNNLVGNCAEVTIATNNQYGQISVRDQHGTRITHTCHTDSGDLLPIGTKVLITGYDHENKVFIVVPQYKQLTD